VTKWLNDAIAVRASKKVKLTAAQRTQLDRKIASFRVKRAKLEADLKHATATAGKSTGKGKGADVTEAKGRGKSGRGTASTSSSSSSSSSTSTSSGSGACEMVDGLSVCGRNAVCLPALATGSSSSASSAQQPYRCVCNKGYAMVGAAGQRRCEDVDECAARTHDCPPHSTCQNTAGGFKCECAAGYRLAADARTCAVVLPARVGRAIAKFVPAAAIKGKAKAQGGVRIDWSPLPAAAAVTEYATHSQKYWGVGSIRKGLCGEGL
jgi:hypothetical protein